MNYSKEETVDIIKAYSSGVTPAQLAEKYNKSVKSIIGKLAREGVYKKKVYVNKRGEFPETKKEIIARIAEMLFMNPELIQGLEKAPKLELRLVETYLRKLASLVDESPNQ